MTNTWASSYWSSVGGAPASDISADLLKAGRREMLDRLPKQTQIECALSMSVYASHGSRLGQNRG
jgi:hypothetical protein